MIRSILKFQSELISKKTALFYPLLYFQSKNLLRLGKLKGCFTYKLVFEQFPYKIISL